MGGRSGGATAGSRFRKGGNRMGTVASVGDWVTTSQGKQRTIIFGAVENPKGKLGWEGDADYPGGRIRAIETSDFGYGKWLSVSVTSPLTQASMRTGQGLGMYLAALKFAKKNNLGFRSDVTGDTSGDAQKIWNVLGARGVDVSMQNSDPDVYSMFSISPAAVQRANISDLNKRRRTTG